MNARTLSGRASEGAAAEGLASVAGKYVRLDVLFWPNLNGWNVAFFIVFAPSPQTKPANG